MKAAKHHHRLKEIRDNLREENKKKIKLKELEGKKAEENLKTTTKINILRQVKMFRPRNYQAQVQGKGQARPNRLSH